jgi:hypothetical protein
MNITVKKHGTSCPFNMNGEYMCCNLSHDGHPGDECVDWKKWPDWCPIKQGPVRVGRYSTFKLGVNRDTITADEQRIYEAGAEHALNATVTAILAGVPDGVAAHDWYMQGFEEGLREAAGIVSKALADKEPT